VAEGGVSVVLAQDRDRFSREPAFTYLLKREFEEHGTKLRALNDRGDETPEGDLTDGILDQLGKYERAKTAERSRRGKLRKAREGKIIAIHTPNFGFKYNAARDNYEVDEERMAIVRRIVRMIGAEGRTLFAVKRTLETEGIPTPNGRRFWAAKVLRHYVMDDVYRPHSLEELRALVDAGQMSGEVFGRLDPQKRYGIWWFNRRRTRRTQVSEADSNGERSYKKRSRYVYRPKEEWIAVPVPDSGIPPELIDLAREAIRDNTPPSGAGLRVWELSGGIARCGECGCNMMIHAVTAPRLKNPGHLFYYRCRKRNRDGHEACTNGKCHRADEVEPLVWEFVSSLLKEPERLKAGLERLIEQERKAIRGNPEQEVKAWLERLSELDQERRGFLRLAAKGHITDDELAEELAVLDETRATAERELEALQGRRKVVEELERDRDALLEYYAGMVPEALEKLTGEERRQVYGMLRLRVRLSADERMEACGILKDNLHVPYENGQTADSNGLCENELASQSTTS
jgi:site-specific DNA recombinase